MQSEPKTLRALTLSETTPQNKRLRAQPEMLQIKNPGRKRPGDRVLPFLIADQK
jgi:hypothetical protein